MLKTFVSAFLALAVFVGTAAAQTTTPAPSPNQRTFDKLSPGNQKIAKALFEAQQIKAQQSGSTSTATKTYSLDQIAAMKQHKGWGEIFKEMKASGQIPSDVKNLGQLVSGKYQSHSGTSSGTTITSGSGRSQVVGHQGKSGKGQFDGDASPGAQGSSSRDNSGRGSASSGPGRGYGYGHGGDSGPNASAGGPAPSSHGVGRGK